MKTHHNCGKDLYLGKRIWAMWVWKTNWALVGMHPLFCIPNYRRDVTNCFMTLMLLLNTIMDHNLGALAKIVSSLSDFSSWCFNTKTRKKYKISQILHSVSNTLKRIIQAGLESIMILPQSSEWWSYVSYYYVCIKL